MPVVSGSRAVAALVIAIGVFAAACSEPGEENKALARAYLQDIVIERNWAAWDRYFASGLTFNGTQISRQALQATADGMHRGFPDLAMSIEEQIAEGDTVVTRIRFSGTHTGPFGPIAPTERAVAFQGIAIDRYVDGKVVEMWHQFDTWSIVQQLTAGQRSQVR